MLIFEVSMSYKLMVPDHVDGIGVSCGQCRRSLVGIVGSGLVLAVVQLMSRDLLFYKHFVFWSDLSNKNIFS